MEKYKLHPGQIPMFFIINKFPGITQKEIAEHMMVNTSTVAIMLKRLEKAGFVKKEIDENDRRYFHVYLTDKAKGIHDKLIKKVKEFEKMCFSGLSDLEMKELENLLKKIVNNLEAMKDEKTF